MVGSGTAVTATGFVSKSTPLDAAGAAGKAVTVDTVPARSPNMGNRKATAYAAAREAAFLSMGPKISGICPSGKTKACILSQRMNGPRK